MTRFSELAYHMVQLSFISYNMLYVKKNVAPYCSSLVICFERFHLLVKSSIDYNDQLKSRPPLSL
jgi:hypothetical protein